MSAPAFSRRALIAGLAACTVPARFIEALDRSPYRDAIVIDGLGTLGSMTLPRDAPLGAEHIADARNSGVSCVHLTVGSVGTTAPDTAFVETVRSIFEWEREIDRHPAVLARIRRAEDIRAAKSAGRLGLVYGVQDAVAFETDLSRLEDLHRLGLRIVQPTYNRRNLLGDGCLEPADAGLSRDGLKAIEQLNALRMLIDLSHCGRRTAADALRASKTPIAFTHTGCAALADHPRNRTDEELRAVAEGGGVCGVYVMPYLSRGRQPTAADVVRHLEHMIKVAGEDHVSIGTDGHLSPVHIDQAYKDAFAESVRSRREAGIAAPHESEDGYLFASDLNTPRRLETLADLLAGRGHSAARIEKILGANLLRLFEEVW